MRSLTALLTVPLFLTVTACGLFGPTAEPIPTEPVDPREMVSDLFCPVPPSWRAMDLPWYGATSQDPCTERSLTVWYGESPRFTGITPDQLHEWWPAALAAQGWVETSRHTYPDGYLAVYYDLPDGRTALLNIESNRGWWVIIVISPAPAE